MPNVSIPTLFIVRLIPDSSSDSFLQFSWKICREISSLTSMIRLVGRIDLKTTAILPKDNLRWSRSFET
jgi:hypothetical protein